MVLVKPGSVIYLGPHVITWLFWIPSTSRQESTAKMTRVVLNTLVSGLRGGELDIIYFVVLLVVLRAPEVSRDADAGS